jgi:hypothetical protein
MQNLTAVTTGMATAITLFWPNKPNPATPQNRAWGHLFPHSASLEGRAKQKERSWAGLSPPKPCFQMVKHKRGSQLFVWPSEVARSELAKNELVGGSGRPLNKAFFTKNNFRVRFCYLTFCSSHLHFLTNPQLHPEDPA